MKRIICILAITLCLFTGGCSKGETTVPTEEAAPVTGASETWRTGEEQTKPCDRGSMYTYDYYYCAEGEEGEGCVYILKLPLSLSNAEIFTIAAQVPAGERDYIVIDYRDLPDSDMQILNSYRAESSLERKCVIEILLKYEENHPTQWTRSFQSMENEWYVHNLSYLAEYETESAMHVNLNNKDENVYYEGEE